MIRADRVTFAANPRNITTTAANLTLTTAHDHVKVNGAYTITLPQISTLGANLRGSGIGYLIENVAESLVTITPNAADSINKMDAADSYYLQHSGDLVHIQANIQTNDWEVIYPLPFVGTRKASLVFFKATSGTTAQVVTTAECDMTITAILAIAKDTNAGNIITKAAGTAIATSFAKATTAGLLTAENEALDNNNVSKGGAITVESSTTNGDAMVIIFAETSP